MSLIKCSECGKEISDKSEKCVSCGCPVTEILKSLKEPKTIESKLIKQEIISFNYDKNVKIDYTENNSHIYTTDKEIYFKNCNVELKINDNIEKPSWNTNYKTEKYEKENIYYLVPNCFYEYSYNEEKNELTIKENEELSIIIKDIEKSVLKNIYLVLNDISIYQQSQKEIREMLFKIQKNRFDFPINIKVKCEKIHNDILKCNFFNDKIIFFNIKTPNKENETILNIDKEYNIYTIEIKDITYIKPNYNDIFSFTLNLSDSKSYEFIYEPMIPSHKGYCKNGTSFAACGEVDRIIDYLYEQHSNKISTPKYFYLNQNDRELFSSVKGWEFYQKDITTYTQNQSTPKCPTCSSTNVEKISMVGKLVSTELFGLASNSLGKTFKCNDCGYKW